MKDSRRTTGQEAARGCEYELAIGICSSELTSPQSMHSSSHQVVVLLLLIFEFIVVLVVEDDGGNGGMACNGRRRRGGRDVEAGLTSAIA
jgi:hypothetical protein